ncbi:hypothetical protein PHLGIDRAFT_83618 [Phlebiopsis gigantea 11061_1 CR5-6]|uniref:t-SNARE coiled-coil homology domain-containing protein n=1 Tax=Phlebiopsis gigantea (strain 11061_1 CR5-6) TaxID=745531 RepID=A0A0C3P121_PHLG1|nr:hypothetical protein PHLGIDRAFT_83618 [Phlebiopsis gigantea 11061_1 CR5-6]
MSQRHRAPNASSSLHNRASLLGPHEYQTPPSSGRSSPYGGGASGSHAGNPFIQPNGQRFADDLEGQNDEALEGLTAKVKLLKDITIGIGNEVRESTVQLSQMNDAFAETSGILKGTFRRMNNMAARQGCRWLWYIVFLVLVFWFFIVVWWLRR